MIIEDKSQAAAAIKRPSTAQVEESGSYLKIDRLLEGLKTSGKDLSSNTNVKKSNGGVASFLNIERPSPMESSMFARDDIDDDPKPITQRVVISSTREIEEDYGTETPVKPYRAPEPISLDEIDEYVPPKAKNTVHESPILPEPDDIDAEIE